MNAAVSLQFIDQAAINPFSFEGSMWIGWLLIGVAALWLDLLHKARLGSVGVAAFVAVFSSFWMSLSSQILIFVFLSVVLSIAGRVNAKHSTLKHHFIH